LTLHSNGPHQIDRLNVLIIQFALNPSPLTVEQFKNVGYASDLLEDLNNLEDSEANGPIFLGEHHPVPVAVLIDKILDPLLRHRVFKSRNTVNDGVGLGEHWSQLAQHYLCNLVQHLGPYVLVVDPTLVFVVWCSALNYAVDSPN
jgi:hypothetical protein